MTAHRTFPQTAQQVAERFVTEKIQTLFALHVPDVGALLNSIDALNLNSSRFGLLLACDATGVSTNIIFELAQLFFKRGMVYLCAWGPDCERIHDTFDEAIVANNPAENEDSVIMTSWHDDESLEETLWFFLNTAFAAGDYAQSCKAKLAVSVDNEHWAEQIDSALASPIEFTERVLAAS